MKSIQFSALRSGMAFVLAACALFSAALPTVATGSVMPSQFDNIALFTLQATSGDTSTLSDTSLVDGDVAIGGTGRIALNNSSRIEGDLSYRTNGILTKANTATITGQTHKNYATDFALSFGSMLANNASEYANRLAASPGYPTTINRNTSLTLNGSGRVVMKLTDFALSGSAILTLQGSAATEYVINVNKKFTLANTSKVVLAGGITYDNVVFNIRGTGAATLADSSILDGVILATKRTVNLSNQAQVLGVVVANKVSLSGSSKIKKPKNVSP